MIYEEMFYLVCTQILNGISVTLVKSG